MKYIKRALAHVHNFFYTIWSAIQRPIVPAPEAKSVMTPAGELDLTVTDAMVKKETVTWYGFRVSQSYWVYPNGAIGSHLTYGVI